MKRAMRKVVNEPMSLQGRIYNHHVAPRLKSIFSFHATQRNNPKEFIFIRDKLLEASDRLGKVRIAMANRSDSISVKSHRIPMTQGHSVEMYEIKVAAVNADGNPGEKTSKRNIIYFHGGGFVFGSCSTHLPITLGLAALTQANVYAVDYRLAPDFSFPDPLDDVLGSYEWLLDNFIENDGKTAFVGESAGGNLVISTLLKSQQLGLPHPLAAVCFSPWLDLTSSGSTMQSNKDRDVLIPFDACQAAADYYSGHNEDTKRNPLASPVFSTPEQLKAFPPMHIQVGEGEVLLDDSLRFVDLLERAGADVELEIWHNAPHAWQIMYPWVPEAKRSLESATNFLSRHFSEDPVVNEHHEKMPTREELESHVSEALKEEHH